MSYSDIEPMPELPPRRPNRLMWITLAVGMAISFPVDLGLQTFWGMLGYLPWLVVWAFTIARGVREHRRFMRASEAWSERMNAYYDRLLEG